MPFLKGVGKAIGVATQGINNAVQTVSDAANEARENIKNERAEKQLEKEDKSQEIRASKAELGRKCPKCGEQLKGISAVCPLCGYEVKVAKTSDSITTLTNEINKLEKKRKAVSDAISAKLSGRENSRTDEKIASLIQNFIVPNTKEDIFEFMLLASGYMDPKFLAGKQKTLEVSDIVINAWASKFNQTYKKAKISFGDDVDFQKIDTLYNEKQKEIEEAKHISLFRRK